MKYYICGPMSNLPNLNFAAFEEATKRLRSLGHEVWSPHEHPAAGFDESNWSVPDGYRAGMKLDLPAVLDSEAVAVLHGWQASKGAALELQTAMLCNIPIVDAVTLEPIAMSGTKFLGYVGHRHYYELLEEIASIHSTKNQDYAGVGGDPLSNFKLTERFGVSPEAGVLTRLSDKVERVYNLFKKESSGEGPAVVNESLEDTLKDLANYALLLLCVRYDKAHTLSLPNMKATYTPKA